MKSIQSFWTARGATTEGKESGSSAPPRRVAVVYGGSIFACRHCYQLAYDSQREAAYSRALSRAQAIRMKLGGSPNMAEDFPDKPKGMHWRTYDLLCREAEDAQNRSCPPWLIRQILLK